MHEKTIDLDEAALEKLVLNEFKREERKMLKRHIDPKVADSEKVRRIDKKECSDIKEKADDIINNEEEAFIKKTVEWLRERDNKDVIIERIWTALTGTDPDSFYAPRDDEFENDEETGNDSDDKAIFDDPIKTE